MLVFGLTLRKQVFMRSLLLSLLFILLIKNHASGQQAPLTANTILTEAKSQAVRENKKILVIFHASWCGWCRKMDSSLNNSSCKNLFNDNYVIKHLVVYESKDKKSLENPGALELLKKYKGDEQGIPYWIVFDQSGNYLADSQIRPENNFEVRSKNTGCPASKEEVAHFITVLEKTSPLSKAELNTIETVFRRNESN